MLSGILIVLVALALLLLIPVTLAFRIHWPERRNNDVRVIWAFGLVDVRVSDSDDSDEAEDDAGEGDVEAHKGSSPRKPMAAIRYKPFRQRVVRFIRELWRAARKEDVFLDVRLGLGDPADTGQLWAWMGPLSALLVYTSDAHVSLQPDFHAQRCDIDTGGRMTVVPLQIIGLALGLLVSPDFWRGLRRAKGAS